MLMKIKNNSIHVFKVEEGYIHPNQEVTLNLKNYEIKKLDNHCTLTQLDQPIKEEIKKPFIELKPNSETFVKDVIKSGIISDSLIDDYMDRNSRSVKKSLDKDKDKLTPEDLNKLEKYELKNKNRSSVIKHIMKLNEVE